MQKNQDAFVSKVTASTAISILKRTALPIVSFRKEIIFSIRTLIFAPPKEAEKAGAKINLLSSQQINAEAYAFLKGAKSEKQNIDTAAT